MKLQLPVVGNDDSTWSIVHYVDQVNGDAFGDAFCGVKSYNEHRGTDFVIRSFRAMDKGVDVVAAASGKVIFLKDGLFDKETVSDVSKGLGNYVAVDHGDLFITYYGHLKKNSIAVSFGQSVAAGEKLGEVGSSGNSTDPHLHFELWYDSSVYIDPFSGPCGNSSTYWVNQPDYDTTFSMWSFNVVNKSLTLDSIRFEPKPSGAMSNAGAPITFWSISKNVSVGNGFTTSWYTPKGDLWFSFPTTNTQYYGYYLYWTYITFPVDGPFGEWKVEWSRNGKKVSESTFLVSNPAGINAVTALNTQVRREGKEVVIELDQTIREGWVVDYLGRTHLKLESGSEFNVPATLFERGPMVLRVVLWDGSKASLKFPLLVE